MKYILNKNNNSKKLIIVISIIFCTVILIIGTTTAFFTQSNSETTGNIVSVEKVSLKYADNKIIVLGPVAPRILKIGGKYRNRIIIKCKNNKLFREMISELLIQFEKDKSHINVNIYADINPESIL